MPQDWSQDQINDFVREIAPYFEPGEPPDGPEFSYPVVDQAVSQDMFRWMSMGQGNGILFHGIRPYWYGNVNNNNQTAQIMTSPQDEASQALVEGFFHRLSENLTIELPMPLSGTTTYNITLCFDPRREQEDAGPIRVEVWDGEPPTSHGRVHVPLWTVERSANQLLSDATVTRIRPGISPVIAVNHDRHLPDPNTVMNGTLCVTTLDRGLWVARATNEDELANRWLDVLNPPWEPLSLNSFYAPGGAVPTQIQRVGKTRRLRGQFRRANNNEALNSGTEYYVMRLPQGDRPPHNYRQIVGIGNLGGFGVLNINPDGEVHFYPSRTVSWATFDGIEFGTD